MHNEINEADIDVCRKIQKKYGKSYYLATLLFPKDLRIATYSLYAFFRVPDEIVDSSDGLSESETKERLEVFIRRWKEAYSVGDSDDPVLRSAIAVFKRYKIPFEYSINFLQAMQLDLIKNRYANYSELVSYMDGSAAAVGLIMTYCIGFSDKKALEYASKLGYAMQLTNFLRDIGEDFELRNRIYMPQDELKRFELDVNEDPDTFEKFMKFQISRARQLYSDAEKGIDLLEPRGRLAVRIASRLYARILSEIEANGYTVVKVRRVSVPIWRKMLIVARVCIHTH